MAIAAPIERGESAEGKPSWVVTPRRREMASMYAEELISAFINRKKEVNGGSLMPSKQTFRLKSKKQSAMKRTVANAVEADRNGRVVVVDAEAAAAKQVSPLSCGKSPSPERRGGSSPSKPAGSFHPGGKRGSPAGEGASPGKGSPTAGRKQGGAGGSPPRKLPPAAPMPPPRA